MNKLLRNRQFDVFRAGNSLGGAIDVSLPTPSTGIPSLDPKAQQRLLEEYDRKKNWLAEPGSVKPREVDKSDRIESGKRAEADEIPNFSRERGRSVVLATMTPSRWTSTMRNPTRRPSPERPPSWLPRMIAPKGVRSETPIRSPSGVTGR